MEESEAKSGVTLSRLEQIPGIEQIRSTEQSFCPQLRIFLFITRLLSSSQVVVKFTIKQKEQERMDNCNKKKKQSLIDLCTLVSYILVTQTSTVCQDFITEEQDGLLPASHWSTAYCCALLLSSYWSAASLSFRSFGLSV